MNPMRMFWGIVIAGIGLLILGAQLGYWNYGVLFNVLSFWPVILILIGLRFLVHDDAIFVVIMIAALIGVGYLSVINRPAFTGTVLRFNNGENSVSSQEISENLGEGTKKATVKVDLGAAKINLSSTDDAKTLFKITTRNFGQLSTTKNDSNGDVSLNVSEDVKDGVFVGPINREREFNGFLSSLIPMDLTINTGASSYIFDFSKLKLENFTINTGASSGEITFGKNVTTLTAEVSTGASSIKIKVPKGVGLAVNYDRSALNSRDFAKGLDLTQDGNKYTSKNYDSAENKINLNIKAGVSSFEISEY